jgi:hypothetical protein
MTLRTCAIAPTALLVCSLVDVSAAADFTRKVADIATETLVAKRVQ